MTQGAFQAKNTTETRGMVPHHPMSKGHSRPSRTIVHAKLEMTEPGDHDEQEADAVANTIAAGGKISRKISGGSSTSGITVSNQMESQLNHLRGGGQAMPTGLRNMMESGFGQDFSHVRLHTDSEAASLSSSIHAKAFTHGNDIYFNQGQFSPNTSEGQKLMAHELTHVVQGGGKIGREPLPTNASYQPNYLKSESTLIDHLISVATAEAGYLEKKDKKQLYDKEGNKGNNNYVKYSEDLDQANGVAWCDWFVHWCFIKAFNPFDFSIRKEKDNNFYEIRKNILSYTMYETNKSMSGSVAKSMKYYGENAFISEYFNRKSIDTKYNVTKKKIESLNPEKLTDEKKKNIDNWKKYQERYNQIKKTKGTPQKGDVIFFVGHTGLVVEVAEGEITTIEGNTNEGKGIESNGNGVYLKFYSLTDDHIMGYGRPNYSGLLEYLRKEYENNEFLKENSDGSQDAPKFVTVALVTSPTAGGEAYFVNKKFRGYQGIPDNKIKYIFLHDKMNIHEISQKLKYCLGPNEYAQNLIISGHGEWFGIALSTVRDPKPGSELTIIDIRDSKSKEFFETVAAMMKKVERLDYSIPQTIILESCATNSRLDAVQETNFRDVLSSYVENVTIYANNSPSFGVCNAYAFLADGTISVGDFNPKIQGGLCEFEKGVTSSKPHSSPYYTFSNGSFHFNPGDNYYQRSSDWSTFPGIARETANAFFSLLKYKEMDIDRSKYRDAILYRLSDDITMLQEIYEEHENRGDGRSFEVKLIEEYYDYLSNYSDYELANYDKSIDEVILSIIHRLYGIKELVRGFKHSETVDVNKIANDEMHR